MCALDAYGLSSNLSILTSMTNKKEIKKYIEKYWGERCKTTDWEDFPEDKGKRNPIKDGTCACCEAWRCYDYIIGKHL